MTKEQWCSLCTEHNLEITSAGGNGISVKTPDEKYFSVTMKAIGEMTVTEWTELISGRRDVVELKTYSRIVGYISATDSWNQSKLGELADRRKGNYHV